MDANEPGQPPASLPVGTAGVGRQLTTPRSALAIGAHPDDVEFGCGGTLAKWAADGCVVHHLVLTDGSKGTWNPEADTAALARTRQTEQREAARRLAGERALVTGSTSGIGHAIAVALANASPFGLNASVWTRDLVRGRQVVADGRLTEAALTAPAGRYLRRAV